MKKIFSMNRFEGWNLSLPLIQGGMGVGVSLSGLAGVFFYDWGNRDIYTAAHGDEGTGAAGSVLCLCHSVPLFVITH